MPGSEPVNNLLYTGRGLSVTEVAVALVSTAERALCR
jgi:hypothetical protein